MSEKFCLKWNDFNSNASKAFGILRNEDYLHDVTLACDDNYQVSAHKLVLSASSEYFKTLFMNNKKKGSNMLLCLEGTESGDLNDVEGQINQYMENLGPGNFACKICGKTATKTTNIRNHIETHLEGISYPCTICSKSFRSKNSLNNHKSVYHNN